MVDPGILVGGWGLILRTVKVFKCNAICNITYILQISLFATPFLQLSLLPVSLFHSLYNVEWLCLISQTARHDFPGQPLGGSNPLTPTPGAATDVIVSFHFLMLTCAGSSRGGGARRLRRKFSPVDEGPYLCTKSAPPRPMITKLPRGCMPPDPLAVERLWCLIRCLHHDVWIGPLSDITNAPPPSKWL